MFVAVALALQTVALLVAPVPLFTPSSALDTTLALPAKCGSGGDEIVVCARESEKYRLRPLPQKYGEAPVRAETTITGNVRGGVGAEQVELAPGQFSQRVMVTVKVPF